MKRWIKSSSTLNDFYNWYDSLSLKKRNAVDDLADANDIPVYDEATDDMLSWLKDEAELYFRNEFNKNHPEEEPELPEILEDRPYVFTLRGGNPTWGGDILRVAESYGAVKVFYRSINPKTGKLFSTGYNVYAVEDPEDAERILDEVLDRGIVTLETEIHPRKVDWTQAYTIRIEDYEKGDIVVNYHNYRP